MKVLHVTPSYYPATKFGGPIQSVHLLNKSLVCLGSEVDVYTTNAGIDLSAKVPLKKWCLLDGVQIKYFPFWGYEHYNFSFSLFWSLLRNISQYDIVHITAVWNFPVVAACIACWIYKVPYIISPRGTIYRETINMRSSFFKKIYYLLVAKWCLQLASAIHYTADDERENVEKYLRLTSPALVIPNGIDLTDFTNDVTSVQSREMIGNQDYILFLSRIDKKKGLDILIPAFNEIIKHFPALKLVVAGPDNNGYKAVIQKLVSSFHLQDAVIWMGEISGTTKISAFKNARLFVLSSYSENFGMSVVEAMACGTTVVISDKVAIAEDIVQHHAGIVTNTTIESVANGILAVLKDNKLRSELAQNADKLVRERFDIRQVALAFYTTYTSVKKT